MKNFALRNSGWIATGLLIPLAVFAAEPLKVKTGLWEITTATETHGMPQIAADLLAKMTPEQQAKMATMFGQREGGKPKEHKSEECVTQKDLEKPFHPDSEDKCETTILKSTATSQDISVSCEGDHPSTGKMLIEATSPESMKGTLELAFVGGENPLTINSTINGRWLGPTCKDDDED